MIQRAVKWQTVASLISFSLGIIQLIILARILTLEEFGVIAIVMVVINISQVLSDLGMANYLVYRQKISQELNSTVFWLCFASGLTLFVILSLFSSYISQLYEKPEIISLLTLAALTFIPISISAQIQARYICDFKLSQLAKYDVISRILGTFSAVFSAYSGLGASSILIGSLCAISTKAILLWGFANREWHPRFSFSLPEAKNAWSFGVYQIGSQLINQLRSNMDTLILGFYIDSAQLGGYNLAKQLIQKPAAFISPIVTKISLPLLASSQSDIGEIRLIIKKAHTLTAMFLTFPQILMCFLAEEIVTVMYGTDKTEIVLFIIPLALFWATRSIGGALVGSFTQSLGKTKIDFYWNLSALGLFFFVCLLAAPYGAYALAWGLMGLQLLLMNVIFFVFYKGIINFEYKLYIMPILKFTILSLISTVAASSMISSFGFEITELLHLILVSFLSTFLYYLGCYKYQGDFNVLPNIFFYFLKYKRQK